MPTEKIIDGTTYRIGRMNAKAQFNVVRRLAPVVAAAGPVLQSWIKSESTGAQMELDEIFGAFGPLATALGELPDEASDYVIGRCLSVCHKQSGSSWPAVATAHGDLMFDDMSMATMLKLVLAVLQENLTDFFSGIGGSIAAKE